MIHALASGKSFYNAKLGFAPKIAGFVFGGEVERNRLKKVVMYISAGVPLYVPVYQEGYEPVLKDHLTYGLLSGLFEGKSFIVSQENEGCFQAEALPFRVTICKILSLVLIVPIGLSLYWNWKGQAGRQFFFRLPEVEMELIVEKDHEKPVGVNVVQQPPFFGWLHSIHASVRQVAAAEKINIDPSVPDGLRKLLDSSQQLGDRSIELMAKWFKQQGHQFHFEQTLAASRDVLQIDSTTLQERLKSIKAKFDQNPNLPVFIPLVFKKFLHPVGHIVMVSIHRNTLYFFDSKGQTSESHGKTFKNHLLKIQELFGATEIKENRIVHQWDLINCGRYLVYYMQFVLNGGALDGLENRIPAETVIETCQTLGKTILKTWESNRELKISLSLLPGKTPSWDN